MFADRCPEHRSLLSRADFSDRSGVEQIVARLKLAAALDQLKRPQPAKGIIEATAIRLVSRLGRHFLFGQPTALPPDGRGGGFDWTVVGET